MLTWLISNLPTIIVLAVLVAVVTLIVLNMIKNKKKGKSSCGGSCGTGCACCPMANACHSAGVTKCHGGAAITQKAGK